MMKCRLAYLVIIVAVGICQATALSSQAHSSSAKPAPDRLQVATKPITPKSAMPAKRKSSVAPSVSKSSGRKRGTHPRGATAHKGKQWQEHASEQHESCDARRQFKEFEHAARYKAVGGHVPASKLGAAFVGGLSSSTDGSWS